MSPLRTHNKAQRWMPAMYASLLLSGVVILAQFTVLMTSRLNTAGTHPIEVVIIPLDVEETDMNSIESNSSEADPANHDSSTETAIFLNVYFPPEDLYVGKSFERSERVSLEIVADQLMQIAHSYAAASNTRAGGLQVYVTTVARNALNQTRLTALCDSISRNAMDSSSTAATLNCTHLTHVDKGGELDTLSGLYEYCQRQPKSSWKRRKAVYCHNKGSFHPSPKNTRWRQAMMAAVVNQQCISPPNNQCSVCGLQFSAPPKMFTFLFPGNFFAASCDYINKLWHPKKQYSKRQEKVVKEAFRLRTKKYFHMYPKNEMGWAMGFGRYSPEHWIGSHPEIQPCDLSVPSDYWYWEANGVQDEATEFQFSMFPRNKTRPFVPDRNASQRLSAYVYMPGQLFRQIQLYNMTPPVTSWMYENLPDGDFWRAMVQKHGVNVINVMHQNEFNRTWVFEEYQRTKQL